MLLQKSIPVLACILFIHPVFSQSIDTIPVKKNPEHPVINDISFSRKPFPVKAFILPTLGIAYGFATLESHKLKSFNNEIKEEVWAEEPHGTTKLDNYLQWSPTVLVYGLNAAGIHGKNNFRDRTMIYLMSQLFMNISVTSLKHLTHQQRPDGSDYFSFPSGHTANAFLGAEFMWQEYKDLSPWLGASGYVLAATTGYLRMYNNKHWLNDVVAGAAIGVASTKLAYRIYPKIQHALFKDKLPGTVIMPSYQNKAWGLSFVKQF